MKRVICPRCYALVTEVEPEYEDRYFMPECPKCKNRFITGPDLDEDIKYTSEEDQDHKDHVEAIREKFKGRRWCIADDGEVWTPTVEEIKKHGYTLVDDLSESELYDKDPDVLKQMKRNLRSWKEINGILESER